MEEKKIAEELAAFMDVAFKASKIRAKVEKQLCEMMNGKPVYFTIGAVVAMDIISKHCKAGLDAQNSNWKILYKAVEAAFDSEVAQAFVDPNADKEKES